MRERMKYKSHDHVKKSRAFCKARTVSELALTPIGWMLIKSRIELVFGHSPQTLKNRVVMMLYPWDMEHLRCNIWCDNYERTLNASNEERYEESIPCMLE